MCVMKNVGVRIGVEYVGERGAHTFGAMIPNFVVTIFKLVYLI